MKYDIKQLERRIEMLEECNKEHCNINDKMVGFVEKIIDDFGIIIKFIETLPNVKKLLQERRLTNEKKKIKTQWVYWTRCYDYR